MTYTRRTIVSTLRNLFTPRTRRTPAGTAAASPPWSSWPAWAPPPRRPSSGACPARQGGRRGCTTRAASTRSPRSSRRWRDAHRRAGRRRDRRRHRRHRASLSPRLGTRPRTRPRTAGAPGRGRHPAYPRSARRRLAVRRRHHRHGGDPMTWDFHPTTPSTIWHASTARSMSVSAAPP